MYNYIYYIKAEVTEGISEEKEKRAFKMLSRIKQEFINLGKFDECEIEIVEDEEYSLIFYFSGNTTQNFVAIKSMVEEIDEKLFGFINIGYQLEDYNTEIPFYGVFNKSFMNYTREAVDFFVEILHENEFTDRYYDDRGFISESYIEEIISDYEDSCEEDYEEMELSELIKFHHVEELNKLNK